MTNTQADMSGDKRLWSPKQLRDDLAATIEMLREHNFTPSMSSRAQSYQRLIDEWEQCAGNTEAYVAFVISNLDTLGEAQDILELARVRSDRCALPRSKLEIMFKGPIRSCDEHPRNSSTRARNVAWELQIACRLSQGGYKITFLDPPGPDLRCEKLSRLSTYIECKRPFSLEKFDSNLKKAIKQLSGATTNVRGKPRVMSCVAMETSKLVYDLIEKQTMHRHLIAPSANAAMNTINESMQSIAQKSDHIWKLPDRPELGGLILRSRIAWIDGSDDRPTDFCLHQLWENPYAAHKVKRCFSHLYRRLEENPILRTDFLGQRVS